MDRPPADQSDPFDIEQPGVLARYLREQGIVAADADVRTTILGGGVSNRAVLVERSDGPAWVVKQALAQLRTTVAWFSDPARIHREAAGLRSLEQLAPRGTITPLVFEDHTRHLLGMQAVPQPHQNWKTVLLRDGPQMRHCTQWGHLLGTIHKRAWERRHEVAPSFEDRTFFETLRLEPYYRYTATQEPSATPFMDVLIADTLTCRLTLVHGDYSPKNVLMYDDRLVLLDHEVIHWGDPSFDLGFSLTHLLSKAHHLPDHRAAFVAAARTYWDAYHATVAHIDAWAGVEERAVRHTLACLLARVRGRSTLEYLDDAERQRQRDIVLGLMPDVPVTIPQLIDQWKANLECM
jgi:5-methylthioribose kinase